MKTIERRQIVLAAILTCAAAGVVFAAPARPVTAAGGQRALPVSVALGAGSAAHSEGEQAEGEQPFRFSRPVLRIGQDYTLRAGESARNVQTVFGNLTLQGHVDGDVLVVLGSAHATATASVNGSLIVIGGSATLDEGARVDEDLVVLGGTLTAPADFSPGGHHVVAGSPALGDALNSLMPWLTRGLLWGRLIVPDLDWLWAVVGVLFLVYLVVNTLFDRPARTSADVVLDKPLTAFLMGLLVLVLAVPAIAILAATVIGIFIIPFVLCAMVLGALVGKAGVARAIGRTLVPQSSPESKLQALRSFLLGAIIITLAYMVPVLGVMTWAVTTVLGVGAAALTLRVTLRREHPRREKVAAVPPAAPAPVPVVPAASSLQAGGTGADSTPAHPEATPEPEPAARVPLSPGSDLAAFPRASFLDRVAAFALDCLLVAIAAQVLDLSRHHGSFPLLLFIYHVAFWAWKGTTLGGIVVGLRVIRTQGTGLRFGDALVRGLASIFSLAAFGIGCFWMLQDPERQMWHDRIAGTFVVRVPRALALA